MSIDFSKNCVVFVELSNKQTFELRQPASTSNHLLERTAKSAALDVVEAMGFSSDVCFVSVTVIRSKSRYDDFVNGFNGRLSRFEDADSLGYSGHGIGNVMVGVVEHTELVMPSGRSVMIPTDLLNHVESLGVPVVWMANGPESSKVVCFESVGDKTVVSVSGDSLFEAVLSTYSQMPWEESTVVLNGFEYRYKPLVRFSEFDEWLATMISK